LKKNLKIALLTSTFLPSIGGVQVGLHNIAIQLIKKGHTPVVICTNEDKKKIQGLNWKLPYQIIGYSNLSLSIIKYFPNLVFKIFIYIFNSFQEKEKFHFWHITMAYPLGIMFVNFAKSNNIKYLIRCAGDDIQISKKINYGLRQNKVINSLVSKWLKKAKCVIAITKSVYREYRKIGIKEKNIYQIPNGVELERFKKPIFSKLFFRKKYNISKDTHVFLSVGRNHPKKNFVFLLKVANILKNKSKKKFVIIIVGKNVTNLQELISNNNLRKFFLLIEEMPIKNYKKINFPSNELISLYFASDTFVFPSLIETFGIVLVEAMAAGLPVITFDSPGCRDVIRHGEDGLMIKKNNSKDFVNAMIKCMLNKSARQRLIRKSLQRSKDFSWDKIVDMYLDIYTK
jgi:glycosyltransferase involved in cell wall biosynthesis